MANSFRTSPGILTVGEGDSARILTFHRIAAADVIFLPAPGAAVITRTLFQFRLSLCHMDMLTTTRKVCRARETDTKTHNTTPKDNQVDTGESHDPHYQCRGE